MDPAELKKVGKITIECACGEKITQKFCRIDPRIIRCKKCKYQFTWGWKIVK